MRMQKKRVKNHIFRIQNSNATIVEDSNLIQASAIEFFQNLLKVKQCDLSKVNSSFIPQIITTDDNNFLCAIPTFQEVKDVVFAIDKDNVARPDGFSSLFYQHY